MTIVIILGMRYIIYEQNKEKKNQIKRNEKFKNVELRRKSCIKKLLNI